MNVDLSVALADAVATGTETYAALPRDKRKAIAGALVRDLTPQWLMSSMASDDGARLSDLVGRFIATDDLELCEPIAHILARNFASVVERSAEREFATYRTLAMFGGTD